jgi:hypothetical protein
MSAARLALANAHANALANAVANALTDGLPVLLREQGAHGAPHRRQVPHRAAALAQPAQRRCGLIMVDGLPPPAGR